LPKVAAKHGLEMENALDVAKKLYVGVNIFKEENKQRLNELNHLPVSCFDSANELNEKRAYFEKNNVFPSGTIDRIIKNLKKFNDQGLSEKIYGNNEEFQNLVNQYLHCM